MQQRPQPAALIQALALHFLHHHKINNSLLSALCSSQIIHSSLKTKQEINENVQLVSKGFELIRDSKKFEKNKNAYQVAQTRKQFFNMLNIFIFNVSAMNQNYFRQLQNSLVDSTASQSYLQTDGVHLKNNKLLIEDLKTLLRFYIFHFISPQCKIFCQIVEQLKGKETRTDEEMNFLETLDYLCVKYSINNTLSEAILNIIQNNQSQIAQNSSGIFNNALVQESILLLFTQKTQTELFELVETHPTLSYKNVVSIMDCHHQHYNPPRKIFKNAQLTGKQVIMSFLSRIIKRFSKNQLFSEKCLDYTPFKVFLYYLFDKHFLVYLRFNEIVKGVIRLGSIQNLNKNQYFKQIQKFFRFQISLFYPHFHEILVFIHQKLSQTYSENISKQLIKKLLLNRFLLNPEFFLLYNQADQHTIAQYVQNANILRSCFYSQKVEELSKNLDNPEIKKLSEQIIYSFQYCLKAQKSQLKTDRVNVLYVNDKILKGYLELFNEQISQHVGKQEQTSKRQLQMPKSFKSDYSLSFSLVKDGIPSRNFLPNNQLLIQNVSEVKLPNSNRSNNIRDNSSMRYMYDQLKGLKSIEQISPQKAKSPPKGTVKNAPQKGSIFLQQKKGQVKEEKLNSLNNFRKQEQQHETALFSVTDRSERQILQELIQIRRDYGERNRIVRKKAENRNLHRSKTFGYLKGFSTKFNAFKQKVQNYNNLIYINVTTR